MKYLEAAKFGNDYLINKNIQNYKLTKKKIILINESK